MEKIVQLSRNLKMRSFQKLPCQLSTEFQISCRRESDKHSNFDRHYFSLFSTSVFQLPKYVGLALPTIYKKFKRNYSGEICNIGKVIGSTLA